MAVPTPISGLPSATPASGDLAVIVHSGVTSKTTLGEILDLVNVPVTSVAGRTGAVVLVSTDITNSTSIGRAVLTALDAASARTAIGAGVGNALTSGTLGQFAATTSAQLAGVLTDETGSGAAVFGTSPTITTPIVSGTLTVRQAAGAATVTMSHDGSNAQVTTGTGNLQLRSVFVITDGTSFGLSNATAVLSLSSSGGRIVWGSGTFASTGHVGLSGNTAGLLEINNGTRTAVGGALRDLSLRNLTASGLTTLGVYTVATLPSASANVGALAQVTDSNTTTNGGTVAGGGANRVPVYSNGTNWIVK